MDFSSVAGLLVATVGGAAVGVERQWSGHASGPHARFGGIRTFTLLGGLAGLSGWMAINDLLVASVVLLAGAAGLIVAAYAIASRHEVDATSEVAALVVLAAGTVAGTGFLALASAVFAATTLLLVEKTRLHTLVMRIDDETLRASVRFAAMACILLPLLPPGPYGPLNAIRPREIWALVLFFSGLSFCAWLARRMVGARQGMIVSGILGGVISSTTVTLRFARDSRAAHAERLSLGAGAIGACTVMLVRVAVACAVLNAALALALLPYLVVPFVIGAAAILIVVRLDAHRPAETPVNDSPLQLRSALQMAALFQLVLFVILAVQARWSAQALVATSAFVGLTDLDALTLSLARGTPAANIPTGVVALLAGIVANSVFKLAVAVVVGGGAFRVVTAGVLSAMTLAIVISLVLW